MLGESHTPKREIYTCVQVWPDYSQVFIDTFVTVRGHERSQIGQNLGPLKSLLGSIEYQQYCSKSNHPAQRSPPDVERTKEQSLFVLL